MAHELLFLALFVALTLIIIFLSVGLGNGLGSWEGEIVRCGKGIFAARGGELLARVVSFSGGGDARDPARDAGRRRALQPRSRASTWPLEQDRGV